MENKKRKLQLSEETLLQLNEMDAIYGGEGGVLGILCGSTLPQDNLCFQGLSCQLPVIFNQCSCPTVSLCTTCPIQLNCANPPSCYIGQDRLC